MGKVLYLYENEMPTVSLFREAIENDQSVFSGKRDIRCIKHINARQLKAYDVLFFIRPQGSLPYKLAKVAKRAGRFVITYCDDDLFIQRDKGKLDCYRTKYFRKTLFASDMIFSSSPRIAEKYAQYTLTKRSAVGDTTVKSDDIFTHLENVNEKVKIVYAAGTGHSILFETYIAPILNELYDRVGSCFSLTFVGVHPNLPSLPGALEVTYMPLMSFEKYREYMIGQNFDIGLAPIHDDEFSKCKYFNKFFEYTTCGAVGIYSNFEPYTYVIENQVNGFLASTDPEDWLKQLQLAIENKTLRDECLRRAQDKLRTEFTEEANQKKGCEQVPELLNYEAGGKRVVTQFRLGIWRGLYRLEQTFNYFWTVLDHLRQKGVASLFKKIKNHLFEKAAYQHKDKN